MQEFMVEIDYWRILELTVEITGDYWKLLELTVEITGDYWKLLNTGMLLTVAGIFLTDLTHLPGNLPFLLSDTPYHHPSADLRST